MKGKISRGKGFAGAVGYVLGKEGAELIGGTMSGQDKQSLVREFGVSKALRPNAKNPVWHCSLSAAPGERLTDQQWNDLAHEFMERMGFDQDKNQYIIVRHSDTDKDHIHIVASRIGLDGSLWHGRHDVKQMIKATQELEKAHGLTLTAGLEYDENHKASLSHGEIEKSVKTGEPPAKLVLQQTIDQVLQANPSAAQFIEQLEAAGIGVRPNVASTGRVSGLSFEYEGEVFKASQLGKKYGFGQLQKRGLDYDQERDQDAMKAAAQRSAESETTIKPAPGPEPGPKYKRTLDLAFKADQDGVYRWGNHRTVAFVDHGDRITCRSHKPTAIKGVVQLAKEKGWRGIETTTTSRSYAAEMYRQARMAGYPPEAIKFDRTGPTRAAVEQIEREVMEREQSRSSQVAGHPAQQGDQRADQRTAAAAGEQRRPAGPADRAAGPESGDPQRRGPRVDHAAGGDRSPAATADSPAGQRSRPEVGSGSEERQQGAASLALSHGGNRPGSAPGTAPAAGRDLAGMAGSYQQQRADSAGADRRIHDLAAPAVQRREAGNQGLSQADPGQPGADSQLRARAVAPHIRAKQEAWREQHQALQAPAYRLTLTARAEGLQTYNHGKGKGQDGAEKFYTAEEVQELIPQLSRQNARGYDIYITPIDGHQHYIVLDDTDPDRLQQMQQQFGIKPCLVQESSPGNLQAIIKAEKPEQSKTEQSLANRAVERLNQRYGDPKFNGVIHPFRLSGFMNQKPVYEQNGRRPIVRPRPSIVNLSQGQDERCNAELRRYRDEQKRQEQEQQHRREQEHRRAREDRIRNFKKPSGSRMDAEQRFLIEAKKCVDFVHEKGWPLDYSRVDYHCAKQMLKDDYFSPKQIAEAIKSCSPDVCDRHKDVDDYVARTVMNAAQEPDVVEHRERELELTL